MSAPALNPPLHVGQVLEYRNSKAKQTITGFTVTGEGLEWILDNGERMLLKQIYETFKFMRDATGMVT